MNVLIENPVVVLLAVCFFFIFGGSVGFLFAGKRISLLKYISEKIGLRRKGRPKQGISSRVKWFCVAMGSFWFVWGFSWLIIIWPSFLVLDDAPPVSSIAVADNLSGAKSVSSETEAVIGELVRDAITMGHTGVVVGILTSEGTATYGYGRRDPGKNIPPDGNTLFEIGSITKLFTASTLAALTRKGDVQLEDPVRLFLSDDEKIPQSNNTEITLLSLATHTSGLPRLPSSLFRPVDFICLNHVYNPYKNFSTERLYAFLQQQGLEHAPGSSFSYSNLGMGLLGFALARRAGTSYEEMIASTICKPLGMKDTGITLSADQQKRLARGCCGYLLFGRFGLYFPCGRWEFGECFQGAGALCSTANDILRFLAANLGYYESTLLPVFEKCHAAQYDAMNGSEIGLGWLITEMDEMEDRVFWHNGGTGGYCSFLAFSKKDKLGLVILSNSNKSVDALGWDILKVLLK